MLKSPQVAVAILITLAAVAASSGCTRGCSSSEDEEVEAQTAEQIEAKLHELYLELEQKYKRQADQDGFALEYSAEAPKTIVIRLSYYPGSKDESKALDVAAKAQDFAKSLAAGKYDLRGLNIRFETNRLSR